MKRAKKFQKPSCKRGKSLKSLKLITDMKRKTLGTTCVEAGRAQRTVKVMEYDTMEYSSFGVLIVTNATRDLAHVRSHTAKGEKEVNCAGTALI